MWINFQESSPCTSTYQPSIFSLDANKGLHGRSLGGISPQGWSTTRNPYLVEFDNGGVASSVGCNYNTNQDWLLWGWDEISWFALQPEIKRNEILKYAFYKTKCLDPNGHLEMPGMRGVTTGNSTPYWTYRANTGNQNQQLTIKSLWNNTFLGNSNWVQHNFTNDKVINQPTIPHVSSSLIFSGTDKIYYIANDGYVHGYIKDAGLNTWRTVSPSYSAQIFGGTSVTNQVKAKSDLTVSPDGTTILYIGIDGFIHGFNILSVWNYTYFDFVKQPMINQNLRADKNLIFTSNTRAFYIAKENNGTGNSRIHGFIKYNGTWVTVSPTYASQVSSSSMEQVGGALTYNPINSRLYYVGTNGFLYYYTILTDWSFNYVSVPQTQLVYQNLRIVPNKIAVNGNSVYYIGKELSNNNALRIHELFDNSGIWKTNSPTWSAQSNNQPVNNQIQANGDEITCSPNGVRISYIGNDKKVYFFEKLTNSSWIYSYNKTFDANGIVASNSLQFTDNINIYYNSKLIDFPFENGDNKVHNIKLEEAYCQNPSINVIEPNYIYSKMQNPNYAKDEILIQEKQISIFPNPANNEINIIFPNQIQNSTFTVTNLMGTKILQGTFEKSKDIIECKNWSNGLYLITIYNQVNKTVTNYKVIIEH
jgi:hypothetical protein